MVANPEAEWRSTGVPQIANSIGFQWGGKANIGAFGSYIDRVHFEIKGKSNTETITEVVFEEVTEIKKVTGLDREGIFRNFMVNKFTFNFFHKNLQFDPDFKEVKNRNIYNSDAESSLLYVTVTRKM